MSNPLHYSLELPQRCLQLIDELLPYAQKSFQPNRPSLGPLTTTFLISMSMPIINLPIERIERHRAGNGAYASDVQINPNVTAAILKTIGALELRNAPFFQQGAWAFAKVPQSALFNISDGLPDAVANLLASDGSATGASKMPTSQWSSVLRNAMSHGGIAYLDEAGKTSYDTPVKMYVFISGKYDDDDPPNLTALQLLRISEGNYLTFVRSWVAWLVNCGYGQST
jgi:hypothetical protein